MTPETPAPGSSKQDITPSTAGDQASSLKEQAIGSPKRHAASFYGVFKILRDRHKLAVYGLLITTSWFFILAVFKLCVEVGLGAWYKANGGWGISYLKLFHDTFVKNTTSHDLALGVTGIFVGFFIALIIELANAEKNSELQAETKHIRDVTHELQKLTSGVAEDIRQAAEEAKKLEVITDYAELIKKIGEVIKHAKESDGELLIMNLTASFGYFMTFDTDRILGIDPSLQTSSMLSVHRICVT